MSLTNSDQIIDQLTQELLAKDEKIKSLEGELILRDYIVNSRPQPSTNLLDRIRELETLLMKHKDFYFAVRDMRRFQTGGMPLSEGASYDKNKKLVDDQIAEFNENIYKRKPFI